MAKLVLGHSARNVRESLATAQLFALVARAFSIRLHLEEKEEEEEELLLLQ